MNELFVELHDGPAELPRTISVAVNDIRVIRPVVDEDMSYLSHIHSPRSYKTCIIFKGDAWTVFVHEPPHEVTGLCGLKVSR